ncbi:MAG: DUF5681 domain-containing protein [Candidatus Binataceae bacterium]|jgi:hypothetical protein
MNDYEVGYGKPPKETRFNPGKSGNPKGRPRRTPSPFAEIINAVFEFPIEYRENGRTRKASKREVTLAILVQKAMNGDVKAAEIVLQKRAHALKRAGGITNRLVIRDWLPDHPGQTADEKNRALSAPFGLSTVVAKIADPDFSLPPAPPAGT